MRRNKNAEELRDMRPPATEDVRQPIEDVPADGIVPAAEPEPQDDVPAEPVKREDGNPIDPTTGEYIGS